MKNPKAFVSERGTAGHFDRQGSATPIHSNAGRAPFGAAPRGKNCLQIMRQPLPSLRALGPLQVLQPGTETVHLVGELLNTTILLSSVCLTTVEKFPEGNMPDEEDYFAIVTVGLPMVVYGLR